MDTQCYLSYVTDYIPSTEEVCSENYKKSCYIELSKRSVQETEERCDFPRERVCTSQPTEGEPAREVCQTQYETSCLTLFRDTAVVEEVTECQEECRTVNRRRLRPLPDTVCQKIPFEACAPDNCKYVPGQPRCHNTTQDVTVDSPEEVCDLQPQRMCKQVYRLVPKLYPKGGFTDRRKVSTLFTFPPLTAASGSDFSISQLLISPEASLTVTEDMSVSLL